MPKKVAATTVKSKAPRRTPAAVARRERAKKLDGRKPLFKPVSAVEASERALVKAEGVPDEIMGLEPEALEQLKVRIQEEIRGHKPVDTVMSLFNPQWVGAGMQIAGWNAILEEMTLVEMARDPSDRRVQLAAIEALRARAKESLLLTGRIRELTVETKREGEGGQLIQMEKGMAMIRDSSASTMAILEAAMNLPPDVNPVVEVQTASRVVEGERRGESDHVVPETGRDGSTDGAEEGLGVGSVGPRDGSIQPQPRGTAGGPEQGAGNGRGPHRGPSGPSGPGEVPGGRGDAATGQDAYGGAGGKWGQAEEEPSQQEGTEGTGGEESDEGRNREGDREGDRERESDTRTGHRPPVHDTGYGICSPHHTSSRVPG